MTKTTVTMTKQPLTFGITYTSNTKIIVREVCVIGDEVFNIEVPEYIILKQNNKYIPMMYKRANDYVQEYGIISLDCIYSSYKVIMGEVKTLKAAKELIQEAVEGIW